MLCPRDCSGTRYSEVTSYRYPQERLFYDGVKEMKERHAKNEDAHRQLYPFRPNPSSSKSPTRLTAARISEMSQPRKQPVDARLQRYIQNRVDPKTSQSLYSPQINKFDPTVFERAAQAKLDQLYDQQARALDKKVRAVFNFLSLNQSVLSIQDFDSLHVRHECIALLRDVIIALINSHLGVTYNQFLEIILGKDLLCQVEDAHDFLFREANEAAPPPRRLRKIESEVTRVLSTPFDKSVRRLYKEELAGVARAPPGRSPSPARPRGTA